MHPIHQAAPPLDGGGWEGVAVGLNIEANHPPPLIPPRKGEGVD